MTNCHSRVAMLLALPPLTVAVFCMGDELSDLFKTVWAEAELMQVAALASTLTFAGLWWAIWHPVLHRDGRRIAATLALAAVLIGQVLIWRPMWHTSGCAQDDILRCAQSLSDLGLWCLGFALTWWGGRQWRNLRQQSKSLKRWDSKGRHIMTPNTVRLAVGFALMPLLPGVFFIVGNALHDFFSLNDDVTFVGAYCVCATLAVTLWWLAWRRVVRWTPQRRVRTGLLVAMMFVAPFTPLIPRLQVDWFDTIVMVTPLMVLATWFAGTARAWRLEPGETPTALRGTFSATQSLDGKPTNDDETLSVPCGNCDYDLRGLREARCPECGWTTTLDALVRRGVATCLAHGED